jgi:ribosome maturation factor RimP
MSQSAALNHLESVIRTAFEEGRCGDFFMVDLNVSPKKRIVVYVDGDEGVSLESCTRISRALESILDEDPVLEGVYELEVSSPGVSRPLKFPRQYLKHKGRTLNITLADGTKLEGQLTATGPESITVETKGQVKNTKDIREIPFEDIKEAYVVVSFGKNK